MSQGIKLTEEEKQGLLADYVAGLSLKEIRLKYKVAEATVTNYARAQGLYRHRRTTSTDLDQIRQLYEDGLQIIEIAKLLNRDRVYIGRKLKKLGIETERGAVRSRQVKVNPFLNLSSDECQYWLGWLASDGCLTDSGQVILTICKDPEHLSLYKKFIGVDLQTLSSSQKSSKRPKFFVEFIDQETASFLRGIGITERKSLTLEMQIPLTWAFVRGYLDGNGQLNTQKTCSSLYWHTASEKFANQLCTFFSNQGLAPALYLKQRESYATVYTVALKRVGTAVIEKLYPNGCIYLERKKPQIITNDIV